MVVKVYVSGSSGNKEVKKRQQRVVLILDSKHIEYELLDIAEPNMEEAKEYMQTNSKLMGGTISDPNPRHPLPPQLYNEEEYCGDYDAFDMANEVDEMEKFLKLSSDYISATTNGDIPTEVKSKEASPEKDEAKAEETDEIEKEKTDENEKEETDKAEEKTKEKSPSPSKEKSPSPVKEKSPSPAKEKSPEPENETAPGPEKQKSPELEKETSPSPQKEKSPSPANEDGEGDNATDDQKAENESNDNATDDQKAETDDVKPTDETEKSDDEA